MKVELYLSVNVLLLCDENYEEAIYAKVYKAEYFLFQGCRLQGERGEVKL